MRMTMCIGDLLGDTLGKGEQDFILERAEADFPAHDLALHRNDDGLTWAVLTPPAVTPELLRFTICRIDPCVMVMVEDEHARRQFRGLGSVEEALAFARVAADSAMGAPPRSADGQRVLH